MLTNKLEVSATSSSGWALTHLSIVVGLCWLNNHGEQKDI